MRNLLLALAVAVFAAAAVSAADSVSDKMDSLARRAAEGAAKGNLGSVRAGLSIYYGDTEGSYPANLDALVPKHVDAVPFLDLPEHKRTNKVTIVRKAKGKSYDPYVKDTGGWLYFAGPKTGQLEGTLVIDCKHKDSKGKVLSSF